MVSSCDLLLLCTVRSCAADRDKTHMYVWVVIGTLCRESRVDVHLAMIWVMVVAKTMCHVVRKRAVTQSCQLRLSWVSNGSCRSRGLGESRSYGSLYNEDVLLAVATCMHNGSIRDSLSRTPQGTELWSETY